MYNLKEIRKDFTEFAKSLEKRSANIDFANLEKLDALKELLNDWSIIGKQADGLWFPTYNTCDIWSEAVQYQASLEADFRRVCLNEENLYNLIVIQVLDQLHQYLLCIQIFCHL